MTDIMADTVHITVVSCTAVLVRDTAACTAMATAADTAMVVGTTVDTVMTVGVTVDTVMDTATVPSDGLATVMDTVTVDTALAYLLVTVMVTKNTMNYMASKILSL